MIDSVGRTRQAIEVLAQDLARQENQADAEASPLNLARNEVLISFVVFGLADVRAPFRLSRRLYLSAVRDRIWKAYHFCQIDPAEHTHGSN